MTDPQRLDRAELRRLEALRRLGVDRSGRVAELDDVVGLLAAAVGSAGAAFTVVDRDVARIVGDTTQGADVQLDRRWSLAQQAVSDPDGRATLLVRPGTERARLPIFLGVDLPVTMAAVAVTSGDERVGAVVAHWYGDIEVPAEHWELLARAAGHVAQVLQLRAEVGEYRRFIELSPDPVVVLDVDGMVVQANPALAELLGYRHHDELHGEAFLELVHRRDRSRVTADLARVLFARRRTLSFDTELVAADGRDVQCSVSAGHLRGTRGHLQLVVHDLSDRLRGEDERARLSEQLARAQRLDAVGQVASGLAHDLNNLLVVMVSNLGLAAESLDAALDADDPADATMVREDLAEVSLAVDRAVALTSKLLQFARREHGDVGTADVAGVIDDVHGLVVRSLPPEVRLEVEGADGLPPVAADPVQLERVLLNLIINARDAVEEHGTITIETSVVGAAAVAAGDRRRADGGFASAAARYVQLRVRDDGIGMDERTLARAFEPLFSTKTDRGGSGLGLPTVLAFADEVDGVATIESAPGEGTTVCLLLPVAEDPAAELPIGLDVPVAGARVLLVDPGERTRRVISRMLQGAGYRVTDVGSGEEALPLLREGAADLLVTELSLPGVSGAGLLDTIRGESLDVQVVALASVDAPRTLEGTPVLVKPFSHSRLLRTVERVLADR